MKHSFVLAGLVMLVAWIAICPAHAFVAKSLDITVQENSDAVITFDYDLTWFENIAVFMRVADPGTELKKALESNYDKPVVVIRTDGGESEFMVVGIASRLVQNDTVTLFTPALSFVEAEKVLNKYWFAPLISPDFSPAVTRVNFPDGYTEEFYNQISIPSIRHQLGA
jgi:hypothetical protein